jgi:hypothetical protein
MCGGRVAASPVKLAPKVKMGILFPETSLEEKALRSMANQCEKALVFQNREVWQRQESSLVSVVLFVGKSGFSLTNKALSLPRKRLWRNFCAMTLLGKLILMACVTALMESLALW